MTAVSSSSTQGATPMASSDREIVITRVLNAPRELVWQAWTDPDHIAQWFGPKGFTARVPEYDLRPGGRSEVIMIGPDGAEYPSVGVFLDVVPFERIVTTDEFGPDYQPPEGVELPEGMVLTATFESLGPQTRLTLRISHPTAESRRKHEEMGVVAGWQSTLDCLDEHLAASVV